MKHTKTPWQFTPYGRIGYEIQAGGHSIAIVNRVGEKRLDYLNTQRSKKAKRGEPAFDAEREAAELEASKAEALANVRVMVAAPTLLAFVRDIVGRVAGDQYRIEERADEIIGELEALK